MALTRRQNRPPGVRRCLVARVCACAAALSPCWKTWMPMSGGWAASAGRVPRPGAVAGHRPQLAGVDANHVGQDVRVGFVALGTGGAVPIPVAVTCRGLIP